MVFCLAQEGPGRHGGVFLWSKHFCTCCRGHSEGLRTSTQSQRAVFFFFLFIKGKPVSLHVMNREEAVLIYMQLAAVFMVSFCIPVGR